MEALASRKFRYIFRKRLPQYNSIEEIFNGIICEVKNYGLDAEKIELNQPGASLKNISRNMIQLLKLKSGLNHVTGHVHYATLAVKGPKILTIHDIDSILKGNRIKKWILKLIYFTLPALYSNKITVISEFTRSQLYKVIPFAKSKIVVVHNPISTLVKTHLKKINVECPLILLIGTKKNKNLERTIRALKDINCKVSIIGKLSDVQVRLLQELNISYSNKFHLSYEEILKAYICCDLVCFASTYEGFGMPIIEAQKTGRPVITSNMASMPEIAGKGACLVDPYDVTSIKTAVDKILINQSYREGLIEKGLENVQRFELTNIVKNYIEIYKEVLGEG